MLTMKRKFSLKRNEEIALIVRNHRYVKNGSFNIYYQDNNLTYSRFCVSVSKKKGNAVFRNTAKRQIRAMIDKLFDFADNKDFVIIVKDGFLNNSFAINEKELYDLYLKINPDKERIINEKKDNN